MSTQTPEHDDTWVVAPPAPQPKPPRRRLSPGVALAIGAGSLLVVVGALYGIGYAMAGDNLPKEAVVSGVPVGGLNPEAAEAKLADELGPAAAKPIQVKAGPYKSQVKPAEAGLQIDYHQSIANAGGGRSLNLRQILTVLTGGTSTDAVVVVDQKKLSKAVDRIGDCLGPQAGGRAALLRRRQPQADTGEDWLRPPSAAGRDGHPRRLPRGQHSGRSASRSI